MGLASRGAGPLEPSGLEAGGMSSQGEAEVLASGTRTGAGCGGQGWRGRKGPRGAGLQLLSGAPADLPRWREALPRAEKAATAAAAGRLEVPALGFGSLHLRRAQKSPRALGRHTGLVHVPGRWQPRGQACAQPRQSTVSLAHGVAGQGSEAPAQGSGRGAGPRARGAESPRPRRGAPRGGGHACRRVLGPRECAWQRLAAAGGPRATLCHTAVVARAAPAVRRALTRLGGRR